MPSGRRSFSTTASAMSYGARRPTTWRSRRSVFPSARALPGTVARTRAVENIVDVYADPRFNRAFDKQTGYRTRSILSMPLIGGRDELVGVIQVLNKKKPDRVRSRRRIAAPRPHRACLGRHRAG